MNLRKEALRQFKISILDGEITGFNRWLFRSIYDLPIELQRMAYRFVLEQFQPVMRDKWPEIDAVDIILQASDSAIEKDMNIFNWSDKKWGIKDLNSKELNDLLRSFAAFKDSFYFLQKYKNDEKVNFIGLKAATISTAIIHIIWAWADLYLSGKFIHCEHPDFIKGSGYDCEASIMYWRAYQLYEWLVEQKIWEYPDIKNWKRVERDIIVWLRESYLYYGLFLDDKDIHFHRGGVNQCPLDVTWKELYGNLCEDDPQPHLTPDDPYDAV